MVLIARMQGWSAVLPAGSIVIGILAGTIAGILSSVVPARQAARIMPAEAIR